MFSIFSILVSGNNPRNPYYNGNKQERLQNGLNQAIGKAVVLNIIIIPCTFFPVSIIFFPH